MTKEVVTRRVGVEVEFHHVDMMRVVHNSHYFRWFEKGRLAILDEIIPIPWAVKNQIAVPVIMNHCEYLWPARLGDKLVVTTRHRKALHWDGRFVFEHSISNAKSKQELASGQSAVTVLDMGQGRLVKEIPRDVWERYRALE